MAVAERVDVKEGECLLALKELHRRDLPYCTLVIAAKPNEHVHALDNLAKDTRSCHVVE